MKKNDAIKQIEEMLPKCFGNDDKTFCTSTRESDEAKKFLLLLIPPASAGGTTYPPYFHIFRSFRAALYLAA